MNNQECFVTTILDQPAFIPGTKFCLPVSTVPTVESPGVIFVSPLFINPPTPYQPPVVTPYQPPVVTGIAPPPPSVADLAHTPTRYDRQGISVSGTIAAYAQRFTDRDAPYTEFRLEAGGASIPVVAWGHLGLQPGLRVRVTGTFHDGAPFVLSGGARLRSVLEAQVITAGGGEVQGP